MVLKTFILETFHICRKLSVMEFTVKVVTVRTVANLLNQALRQIYFLGIYEIFNITNLDKSGR